MKKVFIAALVLLVSITMVTIAKVNHANASSDTTTTVTVSINNAIYGLPNTFSGRIVSSPPGIDCPGTCTATFDNSVGQLILTATANSDSAVYGFNSDNVQYAGAVCPGNNTRGKTGVCTLTLSSTWYAQDAYLAFIPASTAFSFQIKGSGSGTVTGSGVNCPGTCTTSVPYDSTGTFTARPSEGSVFAGWGTYAEGSQTCAMGGRGVEPSRIMDTTCSIPYPMSGGVSTAIAFFDKSSSSSANNTGTGSPTTQVSLPSQSPVTVKPVEKFGGAGAPAVPVLESLTVGSTFFAADKIIENKLDQKEKKTFSGKTIPNGVVHLYFHSDPFEDTATADASGAWSYALVRDIGVGDHTLQIAVTDPTTNLTSEKSTPVKFALAGTVTTAGKAKAAPSIAQQQSYLWYYVGGGVFLLAVLGILTYHFVIKHGIFSKKKKVVTAENSEKE